MAHQLEHQVNQQLLTLQSASTLDVPKFASKVMNIVAKAVHREGKTPLLQQVDLIFMHRAHAHLGPTTKVARMEAIQQLRHPLVLPHPLVLHNPQLSTPQSASILDVPKFASKVMNIVAKAVHLEGKTPLLQQVDHHSVHHMHACM